MNYNFLVANNSLSVHLLRGIAGAVSLGFAFHYLPTHLAAGLIFAGVALAAFRGCPTCWLATLFSIRASCPLPPPAKPSSH
jgi:hypothetical protein